MKRARQKRYFLKAFKTQRGYKYWIPVNKPVQYSQKKFSIHPYVLGAILGDGSLRYNSSQKALSFSSEDEEIVQKIASLLGLTYKKNSNNNFSWTFQYKDSYFGHKNLWVEELFKEYPTLWNAKSEDKFIPEEYFYGSIEQRQQLMQGLLDTDGSIDSIEKGRVSFFTISERLKDDIVRLGRSLGYICTVSVDNRKDKYKNTNGRCYIVKIQSCKKDKIDMFSLPRKKNIAISYANNGKKEIRKDLLAIVDIIPLQEETEMTCFLVDNQEHLFLAQDFVVTHNTRAMLSDACMLACKHIYVNGQWTPIIANDGPRAVREGVLFISTELDVEELQTMALAFLTGINEEKIISRQYTEEEQDRILFAAKELHEAPLRIVQLPNFTVNDIENEIRRAHILHKCNYIFYDYLGTSLGILEEIGQRTRGVSMREDSILFLLATRLKELAIQYNIFIESATQLNAGWKTDTIPDQNLLRGAKSITYPQSEVIYI